MRGRAGLGGNAEHRDNRRERRVSDGDLKHVEGIALALAMDQGGGVEEWNDGESSERGVEKSRNRVR